MQRQSKRKPRKILFKKSRFLENLKTVLNQRIHFDHNEHDPITIRNSFHDSIKDGPLYICSSVNRRSLNTLWACLTGYKSVDDKEWVCKTCVGALLSGKIPACSVANGFKFPEIS